MTVEQLTAQIIKLSAELSGLSEKVDAAHKRINENERVTEGIHKIAANVETLALQIKHLTDTTTAHLNKLEASIKQQGERIGRLEQKPGKRWEALVGQLITLTVAAVAGYVLAKFF